MNQQVEQQIRERAYHLWLGAGMAEGCDREHWLTAEREVMSKVIEVAPKPRKAPAPKAAAKTSKAKKAAAN